jgi:acetoin utilization protein AcuC
VFIYSGDFEKYHYPSGNPFKTERAGMARSMLRSMGLLSDEEELIPAPASREQIETFHAPRYLDAMIRAPKGDLRVDDLYMGLGTEDCPIFIGMYEYAALACGASLAGAEAILSGRARVAFNPSGGYHHAGPAKAAGFCYINDVVLACMTLTEAGKRVAFVDIDVHHGDGVQNAFYDRADVLTISLHEAGKTLYPGSGSESEIGTGAGRGYSVNVPLPVGTYDEAYLRAFRSVALPVLKAFDADAVVLEIGMDALSGDPLAHLKLTNNAYAEAIGQVVRLGKPLLATGGGGYHPRNTARGWALAWCVLSGKDSEAATSHGLGGVLLETTDWQGGLRDRAVMPDDAERAEVDAAIDTTVEALKTSVFAIHGL